MSLLMKHEAKSEQTSGKKVAEDSWMDVKQTAVRISRDLDRLHNTDLASLLSSIDREKSIAKDNGDSRALAELEETERWAIDARIKLSQI